MCWYHSREGLIWGNTVIVIQKLTRKVRKWVCLPQIFLDRKPTHEGYNTYFWKAKSWKSQHLHLLLDFCQAKLCKVCFIIGQCLFTNFNTTLITFIRAHTYVFPCLLTSNSTVLALLWHWIQPFSNFSCRFLNYSTFFSNLNYNCSNVLYLKNLPEQAKNAFCFKDCSYLSLFN